MTQTPTPLIAVVGAHGGAGASCVAAAAAHGLRRANGRGVLVDLDAGGPGLEVLLGIEHERGARWPELAGARGDVDGRGLIAALPRWGTVPVLSMSRLAAVAPSGDVVLDVCAALLRAGEGVVLDLPRPGAWTSPVKALLADADDVLVATPLTMTGAAGAVAFAGALKAVPSAAGAGRVRLVTRGNGLGRVQAQDVERLTGLESAAHVGEDRSLSAGIERGEGPRVSRGTKLGILGNELARVLR